MCGSSIRRIHRGQTIPKLTNSQSCTKWKLKQHNTKVFLKMINNGCQVNDHQIKIQLQIFLSKFKQVERLVEVCSQYLQIVQVSTLMCLFLLYPILDLNFLDKQHYIQQFLLDSIQLTMNQAQLQLLHQQHFHFHQHILIIQLCTLIFHLENRYLHNLVNKLKKIRNQQTFFFSLGQDLC